MFLLSFAAPGSEPRPLAVSHLWGLVRSRSQADQSVKIGQAAARSYGRTGVLFQVEHDFILQAERETFIEQMKDVMDKAEDMLSEDTDADRGSDPGTSPPPLSTCSLGSGEVSGAVGTQED